jgi:hypothetical protein
VFDSTVVSNMFQAMARSTSFENKVAILDISSKQIVDDVEKVVGHMLNGYCPIKLDIMYVFFENTSNINARNAVKILCNFLSPTTPTPDYTLLEKLCTMALPETPSVADGKVVGMTGVLEISSEKVAMEKSVAATSPTTRRVSEDEIDETPCMGEALQDIKDSGKYDSLEHAVPALIDLALQSGLVQPEDCLRIIDKFSVWLRGRQWEDCNPGGIEETGVYPWHYNAFLYTSLTHDLVGENIAVVFKNDRPVDLVGQDHVDLFQQLWSYNEGLCPNVEEATVTAMTIGFEYNQQIIARERRMKMVKAKSMHSRKRASEPLSLGCNCTIC